MIIHTRVGIRPQRSRLLLAVTVAITTGCGGDAKPRYDLSGRVIHDGVAVPSGSVTLVPDGTQGNRGAVVSTEIRHGTFDTRQSKGSIHGHVGGPHLVRVTGLSKDAVVTEKDRHEGPVVPMFNEKGEGILGENGEKRFEFRLDPSEPPGLAAMFPTYEYKLDLPRENSQLEIVVPAHPAGREPATPDEL